MPQRQNIPVKKFAAAIPEYSFQLFGGKFWPNAYVGVQFKLTTRYSLTMPLIVSTDGSHTFLSEKYGVTYHSRHGAVTETAHVFIAAGLQQKMSAGTECAVLEVGFGTGLNAFMSWLEAERQTAMLRYTTLETHPLSIAMAEALNYPDVLSVPERREEFLHLHCCGWEVAERMSEHFIFEKKRLPVQLLDLKNVFDVIFFDAFAPQAQPEMWEESVFAGLYKALKPGGILVTYCAQGAFRRRLRSCGFVVEKLPGPPGKREMTRAIK
jgi:tRNA U34 5-methylaminomethyl-2-thiouridine-forming methyltransferase MnmC